MRIDVAPSQKSHTDWYYILQSLFQSQLKVTSAAVRKFFFPIPVF